MSIFMPHFFSQAPFYVSLVRRRQDLRILRLDQAMPTIYASLPNAANSTALCDLRFFNCAIRESGKYVRTFRSLRSFMGAQVRRLPLFEFGYPPLRSVPAPNGTPGDPALPHDTSGELS
ncbi:hypothetical protein K438DRAFT_1775323 [Mycena galopus ATCC 62051]|nr:hypothetical protein K438DRAFT_1775323 [Mycena galopus ATCC 62051]